MTDTVFTNVSIVDGAGWGIDKDHPVALSFKRELEACVINM